MCLLPGSDEFECQGQRSKSKITRDKKRAVHSHHPRRRTNGPFCCMTHCDALAATNITQQQTRSLRRCCMGVISAACVRLMFDKTSLAFVFFLTSCRLIMSRNERALPRRSLSDFITFDDEVEEQYFLLIDSRPVVFCFRSSCC